MARADEMRNAAEKQLAYAVDSVNIPELRGKYDGNDRFYRGKVRDNYIMPSGRLVVTTDRLSAFDHVLCTIPFKGDVLDGIADHYFKATADVFPNAMKEKPGRMMIIMDNLDIIPVEAVVRAYITGSAARDYFEKGKEVKCGVWLKKYLLEGKRNEKFIQLLFTPSTKALTGHDEDITEDEIVSKALATAAQRDTVKQASFNVFSRGEKLAAERGLILVDTKFEFGFDSDGKIKLGDEILTPDSSRYWIAATYHDRYERGEEPEGLSKEPLRQELISRVAKKLETDVKIINGMLDSLPREVFMSVIDDELRIETAVKYMQLYEKVTGKEFDISVGDPRESIYHSLKRSGKINGYFVAIIAGSPSDDEHAKKIKSELEKRTIPCGYRVCSAHKDPVRLVNGVMADYENSIEPVVYVTVAGLSNGLSGVVAANTKWPVIACPPYSDKYNGADIFSSLRTPSGTPVMTVLEPSNVGAAVEKMFALFDRELQKGIAIEVQENKKKGIEADNERRN